MDVNMTREEYKSKGWSLLEYDDTILDTIDRIDAQLKRYGLTIEMADDVCDGFQPIRVVKL